MVPHSQNFSEWEKVVGLKDEVITEEVLGLLTGQGPEETLYQNLSCKFLLKSHCFNIT